MRKESFKNKPIVTGDRNSHTWPLRKPIYSYDVTVVKAMMALLTTSFFQNSTGSSRCFMKNCRVHTLIDLFYSKFDKSFIRSLAIFWLTSRTDLHRLKFFFKVSWRIDAMKKIHRFKCLPRFKQNISKMDLKTVSKVLEYSPNGLQTSRGSCMNKMLFHKLCIIFHFKKNYIQENWFELFWVEILFLKFIVQKHVSTTVKFTYLSRSQPDFHRFSELALLLFLEQKVAVSWWPLNFKLYQLHYIVHRLADKNYI